MYQANLSYKFMQKYLMNTTVASLIDFETKEQCSVITPKGQEFLEFCKDHAKSYENKEKRLNDINDKNKTLEDLCSNR